MPYELTLRPRSTTPISKEALRDQFLSVGLGIALDSIPPGLLDDGFGLFEITEDSEVPSGVVATVKLPYCRPLEDVCKELLTLVMIARVVDADILDGDEVVELFAESMSSEENLNALLTPFCERYARASRIAAALFGTVSE